MKLLVFAVGVLLANAAQGIGAQRTYWVRTVDSLATGGVPHTHVEASGVVSLVAKETDGDTHIRLTAPSGRFIVCECVPELPCPFTPHVGDSVRVRGIYRHDPEHGWWEIHPIESLVLLRSAAAIGIHKP